MFAGDQVTVTIYTLLIFEVSNISVHFIAFVLSHTSLHKYINPTMLYITEFIFNYSILE
jgi:hypothetical protein